MNDSEVEQFPNICTLAFENHDLVGAGASCQAVTVCLAHSFAEDLDGPSEITLAGAPCRSVNHFEKILVSRFLHLFVQLSFEFGGRRFSAGRVSKNKGV